MTDVSGELSNVIEIPFLSVSIPIISRKYCKVDRFMVGGNAKLSTFKHRSEMFHNQGESLELTTISTVTCFYQFQVFWEELLQSRSITYQLLQYVPICHELFICSDEKWSRRIVVIEGGYAGGSLLWWAGCAMSMLGVYLLLSLLFLACEPTLYKTALRIN